MAKNDTEIKDSLGELLSEGIPDGTYRCTTVAKITGPTKNQSKKVPYLNGEPRMAQWLIITYVISDEESDLDGVDDIRDMFEIFPDIDTDTFAALDPEEKLAVRQQVKNRVNRFNQLGVPVERVNQYSEKDLTGLMVDVSVKTSVSKTDHVTKFTNVTKVVPAEGVDETDYDI